MPNIKLEAGYYRLKTGKRHQVNEHGSIVHVDDRGWIMICKPIQLITPERLAGDSMSIGERIEVMNEA